MPVLRADRLREICSQLLEASGAPIEESRVVADHLVTANLCGHDSHGVIRLRLYIRMIRKMLGMDDKVAWSGSPGIRPGAVLTVVQETQTTAVLDGNWGFGQVIARKAMELAMTKARANGIGMVSARNCNHIGRVGAYPVIAAEQGMVGIAMCNAIAEVAPYGSIDPIYGTNPISLAIPTSGRPILLDMATSVVARGKVGVAMAKKKEIPSGWIIDSEGRPTTDPYDLLGSRSGFVEKSTGSRGALLPFGSYKGSGIGLFVEIMGGILAGAGNGKDAKGSGVVMMAVKIDNFTPVTEFREKVNSLVKTVKSSRKSPEVEEIFVAGDPEYNSMERLLRKGICVEEETWEAVVQTAKELDVKIEDEAVRRS